MLAILKVVTGVDGDRNRSGAISGASDKGLVIGRGADAGFPLQDPGVSRAHCRVFIKDGVAWLVDAGSPTGTTVNGAAAQEQQLKSGDIIGLGKTEIEFFWSDVDELSTGRWRN
jgi:pSer/pThr/pTyr-binding forkhead associated (FHA) protein